MAAEHLLAPRRQRHLARLRHLLALEALVDREAEHERVTLREAALHLVQAVRDATVDEGLVRQRLLVRRLRRGLRGLCGVVRPRVPPADAALCGRLYSLAGPFAGVRAGPAPRLAAPGGE